jgi:hypothetical protein
MLIIIQLTLEKQIVYIRLRSCIYIYIYIVLIVMQDVFFVLKYIKIIFLYLYIKIIKKITI